MCSDCYGTSPDVEPTSSIDRRDFLRLSATGLAGAVLLGGASGQVLAQTRTSLKSEFAFAAARYGVPK
jgi:protein-disulfide isomerase-like protein with CxxC motif